MRRIFMVVRRNAPVAGSYKYPIWEYRVVECEEGQRGYLSEKGVVLVWTSEPCTYRSNKPGSKDRTQREMAEDIAATANANLKNLMEVAS
jgi:hypothetical protein